MHIDAQAIALATLAVGVLILLLLLLRPRGSGADPLLGANLLRLQEQADNQGRAIAALPGEIALRGGETAEKLTAAILDLTKALNHELADLARAQAAHREAQAAATAALRLEIAGSVGALTTLVEGLRGLLNEAQAKSQAALEARLVEDARLLQLQLETHRVTAADSASAITQQVKLIGNDLALGTEAMKTVIGEVQIKLAQSLAAEMATARELIDRKAEEGRTQIEAKLKEMREANDARLADIQKSVNEQLQSAVEKQMAESFNRVIDQFAAVQKAMGDVQAVTSQIGDLKRLFSNVKTRGGWGEAQVKSLLDDILPEGAYVANLRTREDSADVVEFGVVMPNPGGARLFLPIDAKFPAEDYDRMLLAADAGDAEGERAARKALGERVRRQAMDISAKYICPPITVEFAVLYLPTDSMFAEVARLPGLLEEIGRTQRVLVLGPSLLPAMLRTIQLGHVSLTLSENAQSVRELLGATKAEMQKMDVVLTKLGKQAGTFGTTIEQARTRTRAIGRKLRGVDTVALGRTAELLEIEAEPEPEEETE